MTSTTYYSYSKEKAFRCVEKWFRCAQSALLLYMIFCFIFYMITVGIDIAKLSNNVVYLLISLSLDTVAMASLVIGVRGVALEIWPYVIIFDIAIVLVAIGHGFTFCFRHQGMNCANFLFDTLLAKLAIAYTIMLYKFDALKPADYDVRLRAGDGETDELTDVEITGNRTETGTDLMTSPTESKLTEITGMELSDVVVNTTTTNA